MPEDKENQQDNCLECKKKKAARWREDFPVNWESDNYVTRREMVKFLALGSLTIAGANAVVAALPRSAEKFGLARQFGPAERWATYPGRFPVAARAFSAGWQSASAIDPV